MYEVVVSPHDQEEVYDHAAEPVGTVTVFICRPFRHPFQATDTRPRHAGENSPTEAPADAG